MGIADKRTTITPAAVAPAPVHQEQDSLPEPNDQVMQPNAMLPYRIFAHLQAFFGNGAIPPGEQADVYPPNLQRRMAAPQPGPNQAVIQAAELIRRPPVAGPFHWARIYLTIAAALLIAVLIRPGPTAAAVACTKGVGNASGMEVEHVVGVHVEAVEVAVEEVAITLPAKPKPLDRPAVN